MLDFVHYAAAIADSNTLPDSSALEAGILEDECPSRLSHVQDNVRELLRTSVLNSVASSPSLPATGQSKQQQQQQQQQLHEAHPAAGGIAPSPEVLPSPAPTSPPAPITTAPRAARSMREASIGPAAEAPASYQQMVQHMAHQSALFNSRAVAALDHPDLSDPSLEDLHRHKTQLREHRALRSAGKRHRRAMRSAAASARLLCILAALLLASLVATYLALVMTSSGSISPTFHILFVLGICIATILFAHTAARLCMLPDARSQHHDHRSRRRGHGAQHKSRRWAGHFRRHRQRHHPQQPSNIEPQQAHCEPPTLASDAYVPPTPIQVHYASDVNNSSSSGSSSSSPPPAPHQPATSPVSPVSPLSPVDGPRGDAWAQAAPAVANPPPAYGRWRGSVRADPELLHWQAAPAPPTPDLPSPAYDDALSAAHTTAAAAAAIVARESHAAVSSPSLPSSPVAARTSPPSYVAGDCVAARDGARPEMVEVCGRGEDGHGPSLASGTGAGKV